jgi:hypothetical protein
MSENSPLRLSLREIQKFEPDVPGLGRFASRFLVDSYEDFTDVLYNDIDSIVRRIQENPELYKDDKEDRLTIDIKNQLCCMGYDASHESKIGGHVDLLVRKRDFVWIGEAKIHRSYEYLWGGFQQLVTRYSVGDDHQSSGGLFLYIFNKNAKSVMEKWKGHLLSKGLPEFTIFECPKRNISFFSSHIHEKSGQPFRVRHMQVLLHFSPQDKSGIQKKTQN